MANGILDFFSREAGQQRRKALDEAIEYYTPPNLRGLLGFAAEMTPTRGIERAGLTSQKLFAPDTPGWDRVSALGDMASEIAGVVAPAAVAGKVGMPAAQALQEGLMGFSTSPQGVALRNFAGDESGALRLWPTGAETPEGRAQGILDLLTSGRASEVTDEMLDLGDPVANARLNQYLFRNYDLPMDEASRTARAKDFDASGYHGTRNDFTAFSPPQKAGVNGFSTQQPVFAGYGPSVANEAARPLGGNVIPLRARLSSVFDPEIIQDAPDARWLDDSWSPLGRKLVDDAGAGRLGDDIDDPEGYAAAVASGQWDVIESDAFQKWMRAQGFDDFRVNEAGAQNFAVTNPARIRSRFARFDPRLAHLKNLSAGIVAAPLGLLALRPQEEQY